MYGSCVVGAASGAGLEIPGHGLGRRHLGHLVPLLLLNVLLLAMNTFEVLNPKLL